MGVTGVGMTSWNQVNSLLKNNVDIMLFTGSLEKKLDGVSYIKETLKPFGFKIPIGILGKIRTSYFHDLVTSKILLKNKLNIDAVHCWPLGSKKTIEAARKLGIKTFLERPNSHTRYAFNIVQEEYKKLNLHQDTGHTHTFNYRHLKIEEEEYRAADFILCPSKCVARTFIECGIDEKKLRYHHYGYDSTKFYLDGNKNSDNLKIAFVGRCEPRKGLHYALEAWLASKASEKGTFYILGSFVNEYRELLGEKLDHHSIKEIGFVSDIRAYLQECDALILPSVEEGSALVTYEAMACGNTLLVSESSGAHGEHMVESLVHKVGDVKLLTEHIDLLHSDKKLPKKLQKNCLSLVKNLTWDKSAEILADIYTNEISNAN
jgi:glycosyltransferase involved in cell wall biosynthesis